MPTISDLAPRRHPFHPDPSAPSPSSSAVADILRSHEDRVVERRAPPVAPVPARPPQGAVTVPLTEDGTLFLSPTGFFVSRPELEQPGNNLALGDALFRASQLAERGRKLFEIPAITFEQKSRALTQLVAAFNSASPDLAGRNGYQNKNQALQVRASAPPLILDLALSLDEARPAEKDLRARAVNEHLRLLGSEEHGLNRNFMIYDLHRVEEKLPAEVRPVVRALMNEVDPTSPPYDAWFANGNTTLRVDYHVGNGFWDEELADYQRNGFQRRDNADGTVTLQREYAQEEVKPDGTRARIVTQVELVMHNGPQDMFRRMNDPNAHVVVYSGHANYGRQVQTRLETGTPQIGKKVFFGLQCGGKGVHNDILEKYPDLQVVQSRNSSYGYEDRRTFLNALAGFARRAAWVEIEEENRARNSDNYYYPSSTLTRKRAEDLDADGKIDDWDRVVNYNAFRPQAAVTEQLTPKDPGQPPDALDGRNLHGALRRFHRLAGMNEWAQGLQDQRFLGRGYYNGKAQDPIFRISELPREGGLDLFQVEVNKHYAHASEETLGATLHFELGRFCAKRAGLGEKEARGAGLLMSAKCLDVDRGSLDQEIWRGLLLQRGLPPAISLNEVVAIAKRDEHMSAGTRTTLDALLESLRARGIAIA